MRPASPAGPCRCWLARCAAPVDGPGASWKLSGGSQLSSGPTKHLEVVPGLRAPGGAAGCARAASARAARGARGWLSAQAMTGAAIHASEEREWPLPNRRRGDVATRRIASSATIGLDAISITNTRKRRAAAQAGRCRGHARRRLPFEQPAMRDRQPHQRQDDGPHHLPRVERQQHQRQQRLRRGGPDVVGRRLAGTRRTSARTAARRAIAPSPAARPIRSRRGPSPSRRPGGPAGTSSRRRRKASSAGAIRLRRRLSRIFQRLMNGSWLRAMPCAVGTNGNSHSRICQSPRTHRRCRRTCARTVGG